VTNKVIDIKAFIDGNRMAPYQWLTLSLCFMVALLDGIDAAAMGFLAPSLMKEWDISRVAFGPVLSAALFGFAVGALAVGPLADRVGRRKILLISVLTFGVFNVSCAFAETSTQLFVLRLLTGIGLGAAMPTAATLLSEYVPTRIRAFLVTVMFAGFALGSGLSGFLASFLVPNYGWRGVLLVSGAIPVLITPLLFWLLPESARLLAVQGCPSAQIAKVLNRVCGSKFSADMTFVNLEPALAKVKIPLQLLFQKGYGLGSTMLWVSCFMGLLIIYLITGWLPTLITDAGYSVQEAASIAAMFQVGSTVGALTVGLLMDRFDSHRVVSLAYVLGGVSIFLLGTIIMKSAWLTVQVGIAGFFIGGGQTGLNALAPAFYPTQSRATGVSWMNGIGRGGAIAGSLIGGLLLSLGWHFGAVFAALALPAAVAAVAVLMNRRAAHSIMQETDAEAAKAVTQTSLVTTR